MLEAAAVTGSPVVQCEATRLPAYPKDHDHLAAPYFIAGLQCEATRLPAYPKDHDHLAAP